MADTYRNLMSQISELTSKAARFRRVLLHAHSPASYDFGDKPCDSKLNEKTQYLAPNGEELFLNYLVGNYDLVAITDHMKAEFACRLAQATREKLDFRVLPGLEMNVKLAPPLNTEHLHLLVVFPATKTLGEIERIFPPGIPSDQDRDGREVIEIDDLVEFTTKIREHQGICIAAHVDNDRGVRLLFRQTARETVSLFSPDGKLGIDQEREISESFKDFLISAKFDGVEVRQPNDHKHYAWETEPQVGVKYRVPVFLTSDPHSIEDLLAPDRITFVKMAEVSWQGLVDAIKFPNTRIRFADRHVSPPHIVGIELLSPTRKGFFPGLQLGFVENLNCIIGPRGSGKSTVVDAFRYVLGYNRTLDELASDDLQNAIKRRQEKNFAETIIRIAYRMSGGEVHFLEATYDPKSPYATKVYDIDGNPVFIEDVEKSGKYPVRLFGWSEIETLGRDQSRQRDLLDKLVSDLPVHQSQKVTLHEQLIANSADIKRAIVQLGEILKRNNGEIKNYRESLQEFQKLNTSEVQQLFNTLDQGRERLSFLSKLKTSVEAFKEKTEQALPVDFTDIAKDILLPDSPLGIWWQDIDKKEIKLSQAQEQVNAHLLQALEDIKNLVARLDQMESRTIEHIKNIEGQIRESVSADPTTQVLADLRDAAKRRLEQVEALREEYNTALKITNALLEQRQNICKELVECHKTIAELRQMKKAEIENQLNEFQTEEMRIMLDFVPDGDRSSFVQHFQGRSFMSDVHPQFRARKLPQLLARACTPIQFVQCVFDGTPELLLQKADFDGRTYEITLEIAKHIIACGSPFGKDDAADVQTIDEVKLFELLEIQETDWDDSERILRNGQPVDTASPGQRSSAMLPLIALAESVPLIIDQPEDNLDNRLVGKILVEILAKLKEKRQIIVTTHNPNIVVLGDAEQVIVLDAINDTEGKVEEPQASIDHPDIIRRVIELMEGGKEAFETRQKRYFQN